ncbi:MAG: hypothetical protein ABI542_01915 [Gemmatimonadota bacterium]
MPRPILTIEGSDNDFSYFTTFAASADGKLAFAQQQDGALRVFSSQGRAIGSIGRKGEGPGEFRGLNSIGWLGDTTWVGDNRLRRLTFIGPGAKFLRTVPIPTQLTGEGGQNSEFLSPRLVAVTPDGTLLMQGLRMEPTPAGAGTIVRGVSTWLVLATREGGIRRIVAQSPPDPCHLRAPTSELRIPFCPAPIIAIAPTGDLLVFVTTVTSPAESHIVLSAVNTSGEVVYSKRLPILIERISDAVRDTVVEGFREGDAVFREMLGRIEIPRFYPPISRVNVGANGDVWVGLRPRAGDSFRVWWVFDARGAKVGETRTPANADPAAVDPRGLWIAVVDRVGVENIVLYPKPN